MKHGVIRGRNPGLAALAVALAVLFGGMNAPDAAIKHAAKSVHTQAAKIPVPRDRPDTGGDAAAASDAATSPDSPPAVESDSAQGDASRSAIGSTPGGPAPGAGSSGLSAAEIANCRAAANAVMAGRFAEAMSSSCRMRSPLAEKLLSWLWITRAESPVNFQLVADFLEQNPTWPAQDMMERRAEQALAEEAPDSKVLAWFQTREPRTGVGEIRYAEVLQTAGRTQDALQHLRHGWVEGNFSVKEEQQILQRHHVDLTQADHAQRLDRLLWDQETAAARRMLPRVSGGVQALGEARLALQAYSGGAERLVNKVPESLRSDGGFAYDRERWRRVRGHEDLAFQIVLAMDREPDHGDRWWNERQFLARRLLADGNISDAYKVASHHGDLSPKNLVEAEWLAGWIALRFLQEKQTALTHFSRIYEAASTPVTRSRCAYWAGRAAEALNDQAAAQRWYSDAAEHGTTYYGQLAALKLGRAGTLQLPAEPASAPDDVAEFEGRELVKAAKLAAAIGLDERLRPFILRLSDLSKTPVEHRMVADLADQIGHIDLGVAA
ncbi:MAG TPA: hypothetical protein VEU47_15915, partial [Candidatus Cybelea sp.]|nr:hypothetical protein [Candidatus Cybelea sp.]